MRGSRAKAKRAAKSSDAVLEASPEGTSLGKLVRGRVVVEDRSKYGPRKNTPKVDRTDAAPRPVPPLVDSVKTLGHAPRARRGH